MTAAGRQDATGGASALELFATISDPTALTCQVNGTVSGWIFSRPFCITIDPLTPAEEKMLCSQIVGSNPATITIVARGYDDTVPTTHGQGAKVTHTLPASVIMDLERHVYNTVDDDHPQYLNTTRHATPANHEYGTPGNLFAFGPGDVDPADVGTAPSPGGGASPAREDHIHQIGAGAVDAFNMIDAALLGLVGDVAPLGGSAAAGIASKFARADHVHPVSDATIPEAKLVLDNGPKVNAHTGVSTMTYAQIAALTGASLWAGRTVYQTDTGTGRPNVGVYTYISPATGWRLPWNQPWGTLAYVENASLDQNIGTGITDVIGVTTGTISFVTNREYEVRGSVGHVVQNTDVGILKVFITNLANTGLTNIVNDVLAAGGRGHGERAERVLGLTGTGGYKLRAVTSTNTMNIQGDRSGSPPPGSVWIRISDMGPNGNPA